MNRLKLTAAMVWQGAAAFLSPVWIGIVYMDITGHSKGYAYDLGIEKDISIMIGTVELVLWILAVVPVTVWLEKQMLKIRKRMAAVPFLWFVLWFASGLAVMGWKEFLKAFGVGYY